MKMFGSILIATILLSSVVQAGMLPNAGESSGVLAAGSVINKSGVFEGRVFAAVTVIGTTPGGDIDCVVRDENDVVVDRDEDEANGCMLSWLPKVKGTYVVRIINRGQNDTFFRLETN